MSISSSPFVYQLNSCDLVAPHVSQLVLTSRSAAPLCYQAGQYIKVVNPDQSESPLSIACAPIEAAKIEIHLGHPPSNHSAQDMLRALKDAKELIIRGPYGVCTRSRLLLGHPIIFFVRGTGVAPVKAILEDLMTVKDCPPLHLYWGARTADDFYLRTLLQLWQKEFADFRYTLIESRAADQYKLHAAVLADYPDLSQHQAYVSGPPVMVQAALSVFLRHGLIRTRFYSDVFEVT